jgi:hypothetical protein
MSSNLPPEVVEALRRGNPVEAIQLLRKSNPRMGLSEAKALLDEVRKLAPKPNHPAATKPSHAGGLQVSEAAAAKHAAAPIHNPRRPGLSPGEVPSSSSAAAGMLLFAAIVMGVLLYARFG